jgi:hypothetical protein
MSRDYQTAIDVFIGEFTTAAHAMETTHALIAERPGIRVMLVMDENESGGVRRLPVVRKSIQQSACATAVRTLMQAPPPTISATA